MSLVLAFGLSPLGQAPAYAGEGGGDNAVAEQPAELQAQGVSGLQTQAKDLGSKYTLAVSDVTYDGAAWVSPSKGKGDGTDADNVAAVDRLAVGNSFVAIYYDETTTTAGATTTTEKQVAFAKTANSNKDFSYATTDFTLEYRDSNNKKVATIKNAGTYKVVLTGADDSSFRGSTLEATFQVKPYNLKDLTLTPINSSTGAAVAHDLNPDDVAYMGKPVAVGYAANNYPTVTSAKNVNKLAYDNTAASEADVPVADFPIKGLAAGDFDFAPPTVTARGTSTVTLQGKGNFTGSQTVRAKVVQGVLAHADNLSINGAVNTSSAAYILANDTGLIYYNNTGAQSSTGNSIVYKDPSVTDTVNATITTVSGIDLSAAKANPVVGDSDPVATGKVVFGETTLTKGSDYTVQYYKNRADYLYDIQYKDAIANAAATAYTSKALATAPTEVGQGYYAVITATSGDLSKTIGSQVVVKYDVTMGEEIDEVARIADFGSANYVALAATTAASGSSTTLSTAARAFSTPEALAQVDQSSVKFYSATGEDVTSSVGDNYKLVKVEKWTAADEKQLLGEAGYKAEYPYDDEGYVNTDAVVNFFDSSKPAVPGSNKYVGGTFKNADTYTLTRTVNNVEVASSVTYGFNGLPAGDYKLTVEGAKNFTSAGQVSGKFTIAPATAAEGAAAGQLSIEAGATVDYDAITGAEKPAVYMRTGNDPATGDPTASVKLVEGNAYTVATGQADYYVTYYQDGKQVTPSEVGDYDAVFTFGGNNFASGTVEKAAALTVGKAELASQVDYVDVDRDVPYLYTGSAVEPELKFYKIDKTTASTNANANGKTWAQLQSALTAAHATDASSSNNNATTAALTAIQDFLADTDVATDVTKEIGDNYEVSYRALTDEASTPGGKATGVGTYDLTIRGAGKYVTTVSSTTKKEQTLSVGAVANYNDSGFVANSGFEIKPLDLSNADIRSNYAQYTKDYTTVQFQDGDEWVEDYSMVSEGANKVPEPKVRVVTTATKNDENPVVIPDELYEATYAFVDDDSDGKELAEGIGTVAVTLTPDTYFSALVTSGQNGAGEFHVAAKAFGDEDVNAVVALSATEGEYSPDGQSFNITVTGAGATLAPQYDKATSPSAQYVWTIAREDKAAVDIKNTPNNAGDDVTEIKSTQFNGTEAAASAAAAAAIKAFVKDAGKYTVTISGGNSNQYAGKMSASYEVTPKEITELDSKLSIAVTEKTSGISNRVAGTDNEFSYTGGKQTVIKSGQDVVYGTEGAFTEAKSADKAVGNQYVISGNTGTDADNYVAEIEFAGNYTGTVKKAWKIDPVDIRTKAGTYVILSDYKQLATDADGTYASYTKSDGTSATVFDPKYCYNVDYNNTEQQPTVTVYENATSMEPVEGLSYSYQYRNNVNATDEDYTDYAAVTIIADGGNYTGRITRYFKINSLKMGSDRVEVSFDPSELVYTGSPVEPKGKLVYTLASGEKFTLTPDVDYEVTYIGPHTAIGDAATAKFTGKTPNFTGGSATFVTKDFTVQENKRADQKITVLAGTSISKQVGDKAFNLGAATDATDGKVEYKSSDEKVATVDASGNVTPVGAGTAKITLTSAATPLFNEATPVVVTVTVKSAAAEKAANSTFKVTAKKKSFAAKAKKKTTLKASKLYKVTGNKGGKVTYAKANKAGKKKIAVAKNGKITVKKGLKAKTYKVKVKATAAETATVKAASKTVTIKVKVKK